MSRISVNERADKIVQQIISEREALGLELRFLKNDATVVSAGINTPGSLEAGRLFAQACMGGLGQVEFTHTMFAAADPGAGAGFWLPAVEVQVSCPYIACMAAQYAGWPVRVGRFSAIGSGPARALFAEEEIYKKLDYHDQAETGVLMLEGRELPNAEVAAFIADKCHVKTEQLTLLVAPTASLVGSVQIAARSVETGLHKLVELGFDVRKVKSAFGICPVAPVAADDRHAIGRTNDSILYGGQVFFSVQADDAELRAIIDKIPSSHSKDYGTPFYDLLMRYDGDFYKIDRMLFSPAQVQINNISSGRTFQAGRLNTSILQESLFREGC